MCDIGVCCNFLVNEEFRDKVMIRMIAESMGVLFDSSEIINLHEVAYVNARTFSVG